MTGADLADARRRLGLTQRALALKLHITANSVARMERGERVVTARTAAAVEALLALNAWTVAARGASC